MSPNASNVVAEDSGAHAGPDGLFAPLASAFSHIQDSAIIYSVDGEVVVWNEGAERLFGYSFEEARNQDVCFLCTPEQSSDTLNLFSRAVSKQPVEPRRVERVHKDGHLVSVSTRVTPLEDAEGRVFGVLFLTRDVQPELDREQKQTEQQLRESDVATLVPDALYVHREGKILWANPAAVKMFAGRSMTDFIGRSAWDLVVPEDLPRVLNRHAELGPADTTRPIFARRRRFDGKEFPSEARGASIIWDDAPATLMVVRDLSDQERAVAALAESEARQRGLSDISPDAIMVHIDGEIIFANQAAAEMFGAESADDLIGTQNSTLVHPDDWEKIVQSWDADPDAADDGLLEVRQRRLDGTEFLGQGRGKAMSWHGKDAYLVVIRDVSEQVKAHEALQESEARQRDFASASPDTMLVHVGGEIVFVNDAAVEMFRADSAADLLGRPVLETIHPEDRDHIQNNINAFGKERGAEFIEARRLRCDGTAFMGEGRSRKISWNGEPAMLVVIRDISELIEARDALEASEQQHRQMADISPDAVLVHVDGSIVFANKASAQMFRAESADDLIGRNVFETLHPEDRQIVKDNLEFADDAGPSDPVEARRVRLDGSVFLGEGRYTDMSWEGKDATLVVIRDISEHVAAQEALLDSEERHRQIVDANPDAVLIHVDGEIVFANHSAARLFAARDVNDLVGLQTDDLIPENYRELSAKRRQTIQNEGSAQSVEVLRRRLDGTEFVADVLGSQYIWDGVPATLTVLRDVSDRVEAEEARLATEQRYRQILELSPNAIFVHCQGRLAYVNPAAVRMFGAQKPEDLLGEPIQRFLHPDEEQRIRDHRPKVIGDGAMKDIDVRRLRLDGSEFVTRANSAAISWGGEQGVLVIARDVSEEHEAARKLRDSEARHRQIVDMNPDAAFIHVDDRIVFANPAAAMLLGADSPDELVGRQAMDLVPADLVEETLRRREAVEKGKGALPVREARRKRLDGTEFVADVTGATYVWDGKPATLTIMRDVSDRVEAKHALQESEEQHRQIVNLIPDAVLIHAKDHIFYANPAAVKLFGAETEADLIGRRPMDLIPEPDQKLMSDRRHQVLAEGFVPPTETRRRRLDGSEFDAEVTSSIYSWAGSSAVLTMVRDITRRIEDARARQELEERSRRILDLAPQAIFVHGEGKILYVNPAAVALFGGEQPEDLLGRDGIELIHPDDHPLAMQIREHIKNGVDLPLQDMRRLKLDGTEFMSRSANGPIAWDGIRANIVMLQDISETHAAEQALRESEVQHRTITEASPDALFVHDGNDMIVFANKTAADMFRVDGVDYFIGRSIREFVHNDDHPTVEKFPTILPPGKMTSVEIRRQRPDGSTFQSDSIRCGYIWNGQPATLIAVRDVSDREAAIAEIRRHAEQLERSNRELERFAYVASHDLKEPLRMVSSFCELLKERYDGQLDETADQYIDFAVDGAHRMHELIDDLLALSRVGTGELDGESVDLNAVMKGVEHNLLAQVAESGAEISYGDLPTVYGDPTLLAQLFQNLVSNAIKFRGDTPPRVEVVVIEGDEGWTVSVKDNGIGIDPEHHERMFDMFKTLHARTDYDGNGIGLSICNKVVERHGGRLWVESDLGAGAEFLFTLPAENRAESNG